MILPMRDASSCIVAAIMSSAIDDRPCAGAIVARRGLGMAGLHLLHDGLVFPECPRWRDGALWFSDCHDGKVIAIDAQGQLRESFEVPGGPSGLGWLPDGRLLVVSIADLCVYRREADGRLVRHADLSALHRFHTNDMIVDDAGNAYVGEVGFRIGSEEERTTCIALVRPDGTVEVATDGVTTPNGAAISADRKTFVLAQSWVRRIAVFDIAPDATLVNGRLMAQLGEGDIPDGMCLDQDGFVWAAAPFFQFGHPDQPGGRSRRPAGERSRPALCLRVRRRRSPRPLHLLRARP
jgi:sugar lactone lactonase YvrE